MEPGHFQLQIVVTVSLIVCAACVALICDFLKRNNEQLRELTIELNVRREEEERRSLVVAPRAERIAPPETIAGPAAADVTASPAAAPKLKVPHMAAPKERSAAGKERKRMVNADALAAMERGAALAGSGVRPRAVPVVAAVRESKVELKPEKMVVVSREEAVAPAATSVKKDWGMLLSRNAQKPAAAVNRTPAAVADRSLPAGFQDGFVLSKLVQSRQPVTGLVVSIGVNAPRKSDRRLPDSVSKLIESLIGPGDFAAQSSEDEFLLIYPQEHGASAQRRLSQIAQQLWDFQLRSLGSFQILFSWGGIEVRSESIEEAIASASERMQETKRGRKLLTMESPVLAVEAGKESQYRKAV